MKIKNLSNYPMQLGDGRMIGATGTNSDERKYGLKELTDRDQKRFERGVLEVIKSLPKDAEKTNSTKSEAKETGDAQNNKKENKL